MTFPVSPSDLPGLVPMDQGWMSDLEVAAMVGYATILPASMGGLLEVGAHLGRTTSGLVKAAGPLVVVDTFRDARNFKGESLGGWTLPDFQRNLGEQLPSIDVRVGNSLKVLPELKGPFRLILIDGSHEYPVVSEDLRNGWRLLAAGGYMFIDDADWSAVKRALLDFCLEVGVVEAGIISQKLVFVKKGAA